MKAIQITMILVLILAFYKVITIGKDYGDTVVKINLSKVVR